MNKSKTIKSVNHPGVPSDSAATPQHPSKTKMKLRKLAWQECEGIASLPDILGAFTQILREVGVAGETRNAKLLFLAVLTRFFCRPSSIVVKGSSSGGKTFVTECVLKLFPPEAYCVLSSMSEKALIYSHEPLAHRMLVIYEAAGIPTKSCELLLRTLLSEGHLIYETVLPNRETITVKREGPTGLIIGTTSSHLDKELETRLLSISIRETNEQTKKVMLEVARDQVPHAPNLGEWHALHNWLANGPTDVDIPFATSIADLVPPVAVRLRRDFKTVLNLIRAHALLHRRSRERNSKGQIVAEICDYEAIRKLMRDLVSEGVGATVSQSIRETVEAVQKLEEKTHRAVSNSDLVKRLDLDKSVVSRRVWDAIEGGFIRNLETRRGWPAKLVMADPLPEKIRFLPSAKQVTAHYSRAAKKQRQILKQKSKRPGYR